MPAKPLFTEFQVPTKSEWLDKIKSDLKISSTAHLDWQLEKGIRLSPFSTSEDIEEPYAPLKIIPGWEIGTAILVSDFSKSNARAIKLLELGCQNISFDCRQCMSSIDLDILLDGIQLEWVSTHFIFHTIDETFPNKFISYVQSERFDVQKIDISLHFLEQKDIKAQIFLEEFSSKLPRLSAFTIGTYGSRTPTLNSESLAEILEKGNQMLKLLKNPTSHQLPRFTLNLTENHLSNICYLRAFRLVWLNILDAWGITDWSAPLIYSEINWSVFEDLHLRKIDATSQTISAIVGGSDRILINLDDAVEEEENRIMLNIQHLLQVESHFNWVADSAAGSYLFEKGTDQIANKIWRKFQQMQP